MMSIILLNMNLILIYNYEVILIVYSNVMQFNIIIYYFYGYSGILKSNT